MVLLFSLRQHVLVYVSFLGSMFAGASLVHAVLKPDLSLPALPPKRTEAGGGGANSSGSANVASSPPSLPLPVADKADHERQRLA